MHKKPPVPIKAPTAADLERAAIAREAWDKETERRRNGPLTDAEERYASAVAHGKSGIEAYDAGWPQQADWPENDRWVGSMATEKSPMVQARIRELKAQRGIEGRAEARAIAAAEAPSIVARLAESARGAEDVRDQVAAARLVLQVAQVLESEEGSENRLPPVIKFTLNIGEKQLIIE